MSEQYYLPKAERDHLSRILEEIPALTADLAVSITRQARMSTERAAKSAERPMLYDLSASDAADCLQNQLSTTVRMVCEERKLDYIPIGYTHQCGFIGPLMQGQRRLPAGYDQSAMPVLGKWLHRYMMSLAMLPGSVDAHTRIDRAFRRAMNVIIPPLRPVVIDMERVRLAREQCLHAAAISWFAREMGEEYRHLDERRVYTLRDAGLIHPVQGPWPAKVYEYWHGCIPQMYHVGDVLDAHLQLPIRARRTRRAAMS